MTISIQDVEHVANLARLELSEEEKVQYTEQLNAILKYVEQLNELDTTGVEPTSQAMPMFNVMREDEAKLVCTREEAFLNAPDEEDGHFRVPAVME